MKLKDIDISKEKQQLYAAYENCFNLVKKDNFLKGYANEKIKHSMQVVGAGNYILKNEKSFQNKSAEFFKKGKLVCLWHDIGRFEEIILLSQKQRCPQGHSYLSYKILKEAGYADLSILLPIKGHGGMPEALAEDEEYQNIKDPKQKAEVEELYKLVKDADKIANMYLHKADKRLFKDLFFSSLSKQKKYASLSPAVLDCVYKHRIVKTQDIVSFSDRIVQILCFVHELYYQPSYTFLQKHKILDELFSDLNQFCPNKEHVLEIEKCIRDYMNNQIKD